MSYLKVQLDPVGTAAAHFGDNLPDLDLIPFLHKQPAVVCIGTQEGFVMLDDDHVTIANQAPPCIHHCAISRCLDRLTQLPGNINPFIQTAV